MGVLSLFSLDCAANWGKESTVEESIKLFDKAHKSIKIVAGRFDNQFYRDERIISTLNKAIDRGVSVDIISYPSETNKKHGKTFIEKVPYAKLIDAKEKPPRHWAIVDGKHVRIERSHPEESIDTPAFICNNAKILAEELDNKIERLARV